MKLKDITSEICVKCGKCCNMQATVRGDEEYLEFLKLMGFKVTQDRVNKQYLLVDLGTCSHLDKSEGLNKCKIYENRPQLCRDYYCLDWALFSNSIEKSHFVKHAKKVYDEISRSVNEAF